MTSLQRCSFMLVIVLMLLLTAPLSSVSLLLSPSISPTLRPTHIPTIPIPTHSPTSSPTPCTVPTQQYDALYALYTSTNGPKWSKECNNWVFPSINPDYSAPCNGWYGITCNSQCDVTQLILQRCRLSGTIPSQIGNMPSTIYLYLSSNSLTGTIPIQLGSLTSMTYLYLDSNSLTGTIPSELGYMTSMTYLGLYINSLTGTIPSQLGSMTSILTLDLDSNSLTGTIPSHLSSLSKMTSLYLFSNSLTGTIPSQLGSLNRLTYLSLYINSLTGTIPSQLGYITSMQFLVLGSNMLTGTIPSQLGSMTKMQYLLLYSNSLTGTIPSQLGYMTSMAQLYLWSNSLTGTIPSQLGYMSSILELFLWSNSLTGTIPSQLGSMTKIVNLYLSNNSLTGTIPSQLGSMSKMTYLDLGINSLTGTIPSQLNKCTSLGYLYLQNNNLVGSIPSSILTLSQLEIIDLSYNQYLTGNITSLFNTNITKSLQYIILSSMSLTGSIPTSLFSLPKLYTLILSSNCITGTLSSSVCKSSSLLSLILDGVGVGSSCNSRSSSFHGSIPSCLFSMQSLNTLHLAGNGLTGTLPEISVNSSLTNISFTSNRLTGDIPRSMQMHVFTNIDLSSNKLSGTLIDTYQPPNSSLTLTVNRLSAKIPVALRATNSTVSAIEGNLFGCPLLSNDIKSKETSCGSSNVEYPMIAWLVGFILILLVLYYFFNPKLRVITQKGQSLLDWWRTSYQCLSSQYSPHYSNNLYHTRGAIQYLERAGCMSLVLSVLYIVVVMVSFIIMKLLRTEHINSLYQVQYLYTITAAYLVGMTPAVLIWLYITVSGVAVVLLSVVNKPELYTDQRDQQHIKRIETCDEPVDKYYLDSIKSVAIRVVVSVVVSTLAIAINYGFVQVVYFNKPSNLTLINLAFAIIKTVVGATVVPFSTKLLPKASRQSHTILMRIILNIVGPGLAVLLSSPLCLFNYIVKKHVSVTYEYPLFQCGSSGFCLLLRVSGTSIITPQWFYSYQCSSSYLTSYLPNFIYMYIISGTLSPLLNLLAMVLLSSSLQTRYKEQNQEQSFFKVFNFMFQFIDDKLRIGRIFYIFNHKEIQDTMLTDALNPVSSSSVEMGVLHPSTDDSSKDHIDFTVNRITTVYIEPTSHKDYDITVASLMPSLCVDITMLLTFGLASPLFAVMISCSIIINTLLWRLALGRYITIVSKATSSRACYEKLERAFEDEWRCLPRSWPMMSVFIGLFWSLFVFDMIGDKDHKGGIVAAALMVIWCPCVFISLQWLLSVNPDTDTDSSRLHTIREHAHDMSSWLHDVIWKHVLRLDSTSTNDSGDGISDGERFSTISETISPIGSLDNTTNTTITSKTAPKMA